MSLLDDLIQLLETAGVAHGGVDLFKSFLPEAPDACAVLREYGGMTSFTQDGAEYQTCRVQLRCRGAQYDYDGPREQARLIAASLQRANTTINGVRYQRIRPLGVPYEIARDSTGRVEIGCTLEVQKEVS